MKILIVDDHPLVRAGLDAIAREVFDNPLIVTAGCCARAIEKARAVEALDMVLLDLGLPDCAGLDTLRRFRPAHRRARVIVFADFDDVGAAAAAMQSGARGFVSKTLGRTAISAALRMVAAGGTYPPVLAASARRRSSSWRRSSLTGRQVDVLWWIAQGLTNKEIGMRLNIAPDTVKQHARTAYATLGVSSRTQAMKALAGQGVRFG